MMLLVEQINYLQANNRQGSNDVLIEFSTDAYGRLANQIGAKDGEIND